MSERAKAFTRAFPLFRRDELVFIIASYQLKFFTSSRTFQTNKLTRIILGGQLRKGTAGESEFNSLRRTIQQLPRVRQPSGGVRTKKSKLST
jgi:hypothetical protein